MVPFTAETLFISKNALVRSGKKLTASPETTMSNVLCPLGMFEALPITKSTSLGSFSFVFSKNSAEGSIHDSFVGLQFLYIASLRAPVPHPTSSHDKLWETFNQSRNNGAT